MQENCQLKSAESISVVKCGRTIHKIWSPLCSVSGQDIIAVFQKAHARSLEWRLHLSVSVNSPNWLLFPSCRGLEMRENAKLQMAVTQKGQAGCCQMNEDVTRARSGFHIMTAECGGTLAHILCSESSRSQRRSFLCKQCRCFPADVWMGSSSLSLGGLYPTGIQLSPEWGGDAIK